MSPTRSQLLRAVAIGAGATALMDVTAEILRRTRGTRSLDYGLVGRWIGHMPSGTFAHRPIMAAEPVPGERPLGWAAHYGIGIGFAAALVALKPDWVDRPTLAPALAMGVGTVAAPWLLMQPAFGMGVAAAKTPDPAKARMGSLRAHATYGAGLWLSAKLLRIGQVDALPLKS
ncbi:DUF2938 domain-containing protein [Corynebacterium hansenii]|uniref:DUF2938 domain-containing protein n=1 Tax=Corynebacterium hansenii TaxID=394964 RepID=A0ABV7ZSZ7_9CORY|nr:DUF2938 domain-containing protein [Corynebacterium hansenii]WJY99724.1 hypothetical protein CHAN_05525 [Corynebacterium hansenii]